MSYCVNCGVELDKTCCVCPLCGTPVANPRQPVDTQSPKPFPTARGNAEPVKRSEFTILMSIIFSTTALVCYLLNHLVFSSSRWSVYVIGVCAVLWIFLLPFFFPERIPIWLCLILDGFSIAGYLAAVSWLHPGNGWYLDIALPITILATVLITVLYLFTLRKKSSFIVRTALLLGDLALLCVSIELLAAFHSQRPLMLSWSAVVLTCCVSIDVILTAIYFLKGIREEFRRRMHF